MSIATDMSDRSEPQLAANGFPAHTMGTGNPASEARHVTPATGQARPMAGGQRGAARVLIADNDAAIRSVVSQTLLEAGYRAFIAADGAAALVIAERSGPFSLILLDLWMPIMSGAQFAWHYHSQPGPHAPLVLLTADTAAQAAADATRLGAAGYLVKPFDLDALVALVDQHVRPPHGPGRREHQLSGSRHRRSGPRAGPGSAGPVARRDRRSS
jgi:two-component system chemotaxis response regulator CheY